MNYKRICNGCLRERNEFAHNNGMHQACGMAGNTITVVADTAALEAKLSLKESQLALAKEALESLGAKLNTISTRANTYGPGFPPTYADALWLLNQEARKALEKLSSPSAAEGEKK